jgi:hypothetical protein
VRDAPSVRQGMTRSGSFAAKGSAPSVMKASPSTPAALPASRSSSVKRWRASCEAMATARGGVIPAAITAAIGVKVLLDSSPTEKA